MRHPWVRTGVTVLLAWACAAAYGTEAPAPCRVAGLRNEVQCGVLRRPLDPAQPGGTAIELHYVVVPAMARRKLPDPVFLLAGGPGQSAIGVAPQLMPQFARLNNRRDIVFVDQRGTGRSAPLDCEGNRRRPLAEMADPERQVEQLQACRQRLSALPHGDLRMYTTPIAAQDLDAVRLHLGAEQVNLVGASYGTRVALEYLRQRPLSVRRVVLDGVVPPDMVLPVSISTDAQAAFDTLLDACAQEAACVAAHPTLRADWQSLLSKLPRRVSVTHPLTGRSESLEVTRDMVLGLVRGLLYAPAIAAALPQAIDEAVRGRFDALMGLNSLFAPRQGTALAMGMHFSVVCAEDVPRIGQASDAPGSDFGSDFAHLYQRVCADWPRGDVPTAFYRVPESGSPVLLLSGAADPAAPPRHASRVAQALGANALHVVVPNGGHGLLGLGCSRDLLFRFIDAADAAQALALDMSCLSHLPRPPAFRPIALPAEAGR